MADGTNQSPKRGPGRPRKSSILADLGLTTPNGIAGSDGSGAIDPDSIPEEADGGNTASTDGTRSNTQSAAGKTGTTGAKAKTSFSVGALENLLLQVHSALASVASTPELALSQEDARNIAVSYQAMQRHYASALTAKQIDTLTFVGVVGTIYGSRIITIAKKQKKAMPAKPQQNSTVTPFPGGGIPGIN
jgi:hypothetical protein